MEKIKLPFCLPADRVTLFPADLPSWMTLRDIEKFFRIKPGTIRNMLSRFRVAGQPFPFPVLQRRPLLIQRAGFQDWLLKTANASVTSCSASTTGGDNK